MAKHSPGLPELREALVAHADEELTELELQPDGERDVERLRRVVRAVRVIASLPDTNDSPRP
jgi:hypothetical protein